MNILLKFREESYERALKNALSNYSTGIYIEGGFGRSIGEEAYMANDVILTDDWNIASKYDRSVYLSTDPEKLPDEGTTNHLCMTSTLSEIFKETVEAYEQISDMRFCSLTAGIQKVTSFKCLAGGAGVTTLALTMGHHMISRYSERVLYISQKGEENFIDYVEIVERAPRPSSELKFLLNQNKEFSIQKYISRDEMGLDILIFDGNLKELIARLGESGEYEQIIVDGTLSYSDGRQIDEGHRDESQRETFECAGYQSLLVLNYRDLRYGLAYERAKPSTKTVANHNFILTNFAPANLKRDNEYVVEYDEDAFRLGFSKIELKSGSVFSSQVMRILEDLRRKQDEL